MTTTAAAGGSSPSSARPPLRHRLLILVIAAAVVVAGGAVALALTGQPHRGAPARPEPGVSRNGAPASLATVARRDLAARINVPGTLGYAGRYVVVNQLAGTVTWLPRVGTRIGQGGVLYRVDDTPVVLLYGSTPAYRTLGEGVAGGPDVRQLNAALAALGCDTSAPVDPSSDTFTWATAAAVRVLQARLRVPVDGQLPLGRALFLPGTVRVTRVRPDLGSPAGPGQEVINGSSTRRAVHVDLPATEQAYVKRGDRVEITLPDRTTAPGTVTDIASAATSAGSPGPAGAGGSAAPTVSVQITPDAPARTGSLDQAPVQVAITTATASGALSVPVGALLALAGGGYAVEIAPPRGPHRLAAVTPGLFDGAEGLVAVTGAGLAAGMRVVVAAS